MLLRAVAHNVLRALTPACHAQHQRSSAPAHHQIGVHACLFRRPERATIIKLMQEAVALPCTMPEHATLARIINCFDRWQVPRWRTHAPSLGLKLHHFLWST